MNQNLLKKTSINSTTMIIVPDLSYNQQTIKVVVERRLQEIHPIKLYIDIAHLTNKSVTQISRVDIDNVQSARNKRRNLKTRKTPADENCSQNSSISSSNLPHPNPTMPTTIQISTMSRQDDNSPTISDYAQLTLAAISEIDETALKGKNSGRSSHRPNYGSC